ncbi:MAG: pro-sigmaK processing inhibitor BofA family protein [Peptococcaceae bacterium]|nr:pro-sigmaK processing inhibitor BofA family protein [Peptococcaceae bacterium]
MIESMEQLIALLVFSAFVIFLLAKLFASPLQSMLKLMLNSVIAVVLLCFAGIIGEYLGINFPINPLTIVLVAILGLPGLILIALMNFLLI